MIRFLKEYKLTFVALLAVVSSVFVAQKIVQDWNPEFSFWTDCFEKKRTEITALRKRSGSMVIFAGGSTCAFSIDPSVFEESPKYSFYNFGGAVPMGSDYLISSALKECEAGDTLVLALEPTFLTSDESKGLKTLGVSMARHDHQLGHRSQGPTTVEILRASRPGASFSLTMLGKKMLGLPSYRYSMDNFREGGRLSTLFKRGKLREAVALPVTELSTSGQELLKSLIQEASEKQVKLLYTLPWTLTRPDVAQAHRIANQMFLKAVGAYVPVVHDPYCGVHTDFEFFADTPNHLSDEGAYARTLAMKPSLIELLKNQ